MRFYTKQHQFYCGIDLHARTMYVCILNQDGEILVHRNMKASPEPFLKAIAPYREDLVVAVECIFTWYWLADLCAQEGMPFVLGPRALYESDPRRQGQKRQDRLPRKSPCCSAAACSRRPMSIPPRCGRPGTCSGAGCI